ncbi:MAG TPA: biotin carboxylase N-terminal domain-containing protein [Steroidobacteraceae bacterium]|nr:biotin carboxylase N-terminal domain-containing protein [Steroidobacteraceae bacterium]
MFHKLLIANRGEIACRIARTAHRLGLKVAAVYSDVDARARHVRLADEAWAIGAGPATESYLNIDRIIDAARRAGADAIHPGYGFLAENAAFAAACAAAGITFVGPPASAIEAMGSKSAAKSRMHAAGVPTLPGYHGEEQSVDALVRHAVALGFPLIIKPSGGGGGKGMHIVAEASELSPAIATAKRLAAAAFKDDKLLLERYLPAPRHVEVQVFADRHGGIVHLFDRDCSVQRRHQKLIEEAPAPGIDADVRESLHSAACTVAREIGYVGAGTVEFLLSGREFYFMEMNTRLQVEHPVTERITGLDLVEWQLRVAAGEPLPLSQSEIRHRGHAIEVRICAEDPSQGFVPSAGDLELLKWPEEVDGIRVDAGFETGDTVSPLYDSLLGKVISHADTREAAIDRLVAALDELRVSGVATNAQWLARALLRPDFREANVSTAFLARNAEALAVEPDPTGLAPFAAVAYAASLAPAGPVSSPWELADGFRVNLPPAIRVRLRPATHGASSNSSSRVIDATVGVQSAESAEVHVGSAAPQRLTRLPGVAPLQQWQSAAGGERASVLVARDRITVWQSHAQAIFTLDDGLQLEASAGARGGSLSTPLPGVVVNVAVKEGDTVAAGQTLLVVEAMKMEHAIKAPRAGVVKALKYRVGDRVREGNVLAEVE